VSSRLDHVPNWPELARQENWCAQRLARACNVSLRTLDQFFLETMAKCPHEWLFEERMKEAVELRKDGSSVKDTAAILGYKHATHFSRDFKKRWGCSPSAFYSRKDVQKKPEGQESR
jgi:AraC-like DNA-binding protein